MESWDRRLMAGLARESWLAANEPERKYEGRRSLLLRSWYGRASYLGLLIYLAILAVFGLPWALLFPAVWWPIGRGLERRARADLWDKGISSGA
jgi:hypothetical protein